MSRAADASCATAPNASGRANRVAPDGSVAAVAARGLLWGNRGRLLGPTGELVRHSTGRGWVTCRLEFHDRHRTQWQPGRLTELYFLDEPTALAAGHRPCGECRHGDYQRFKAAWASAYPHDDATAQGIDQHLHADRLEGRDWHLTHEAELADLPDGVVLEHDGRFWLVRGERLHAWGFAGYVDSRSRRRFPPRVVVRTPRATVATLRAGFEPEYHPSVGA